MRWSRLAWSKRTLSSPGMQTALQSAVPSLHNALNHDERGAVFTKPEVVEFILDLVGYDTSRVLAEKRILEPSCGHGEFVLGIVDRLMASYLRHGGSLESVGAKLGNAIIAVEAHDFSAQETQSRVAGRLKTHGVSEAQARRLAASWIVVGDFLLAKIAGSFDFVVGNPPYVRQELIPDELLATYRELYKTLYNRADLYVPFIERGLTLLSAQGKLCFICSDRWMKCAYGKPLRALVSKGYHLDAYVDMVDTPAFQQEVIAYPAVNLLSRQQSPPVHATLAAYRPKIERGSLRSLSRSLIGKEKSNAEPVQKLLHMADSHHPWLLDSNDRLTVIRSLERRLPLLEDAGCKVGIGVATGCDRAYIGGYDSLDVEKERKLPLVTAGDIRSGKIEWGGSGVINPFERDGRLAALQSYAKFRKYIEARSDLLKARNVAKRSGEGWYRTIDRIWHDLTTTPKLLIPDIKGEANVVYDEGRFYPHHNLYWVTSPTWELRALQCLLRSSIAKAFVATYCVKMAGGFLRFQAQYLRRIRIPQWEHVSAKQRGSLVAAVKTLDQGAIDRAAFDLYDLTERERKVMQEFHDRPTGR
jgi:hypothetical protein